MSNEISAVVTKSDVQRQGSGRERVSDKQLSSERQQGGERQPKGRPAATKGRRGEAQKQTESRQGGIEWMGMHHQISRE